MTDSNDSAFEPDEFVRSILGRNESVNLDELVAHFSGDYDLRNLEALLSSDNDSLVGHSAYILSELGTRGMPLLEFTRTRLLGHRSASVRLYALDSVLACADASTAQAVADALALLDDPSDHVRAKAIDFAAKKNLRALAAALPFLQAGASANGRHVTGINLVLNAGLKSIDDIRAAITAADRVIAGYGTAAASRLVRGGSELLKVATSVSDEVVSAEAARKQRNP